MQKLSDTISFQYTQTTQKKWHKQRLRNRFAVKDWTNDRTKKTNWLIVDANRESNRKKVRNVQKWMKNEKWTHTNREWAHGGVRKSVRSRSPHDPRWNRNGSILHETTIGTAERRSECTRYFPSNWILVVDVVCGAPSQVFIYTAFTRNHAGSASTFVVMVDFMC